MKVTVEVTIEEECHRPRPHCRKLFVSALYNLPQGVIVTMPTNGTPVTVSFPVPAPGSNNQVFTFHVNATDQTGATVTPIGLSATSDNGVIVPTLLADGVSFDIAVNDPSVLTGNVSITDSSGDTLVVAVDQTAAGVPTITLSGFADPVRSQ